MFSASAFSSPREISSPLTPSETSSEMLLARVAITGSERDTASIPIAGTTRPIGNTGSISRVLLSYLGTSHRSGNEPPITAKTLGVRFVSGKERTFRKPRVVLGEEDVRQTSGESPDLAGRPVPCSPAS